MHPLIQYALDFHNKKLTVSAYDFAIEFINRRYKSNIQLDSVVSDCIDEIFAHCDLYEPNSGREYEITSEAEFRAKIAETLKKINVL